MFVEEKAAEQLDEDAILGRAPRSLVISPK
jgi:hypothetical protein